MGSFALLLLLSALSFQPGALESGSLPGIPERGRERLLGAAAPCGNGSAVCAVDGSGWSNATVADFAGRLPGDLRELRLKLFRSKLDDACLAVLAAQLPGRLQHLQLDLDRTSVGDRGLERLAEALPACLDHLQLHLGHTKVGDRGLGHLAEALPAGLGHLELHVFLTKVGNRGLESLAEHLPAGLEHLNLDFLFSKSVGDPGVERLAQALPARLDRLQLILGGTNLSDRGLKRLAEALPAGLGQLQLRIGKTSVGDPGLESLAEHLPPRLQHFDLALCRTSVGDRGLERLAEALPACLESLRLRMGHTSVGDRGLERLAESLPPRLKRFHLAMRFAGADAGKHLRKMLPQHRLKDLAKHLVPGAFNDKVSLHYVKAIFKELPAGLEELSLDGDSCDLGWRRAVGTEQPSNQSSTAIWPYLWAAVHSGQRLCVVMLVLAAGSPNLQDPTTGETALILAASEGHVEVTRDLVSLGADVLDRDNQGRSARDVASSSKIPALLLAIPEPTFPEVLGHMSHQAQFWINVAACLLVAAVACAPLDFGDTGRNAEGGLPSGAVKLATKAMHGQAMAGYACLTRILEVIANLAAVTMVLHRVTAAVAVPTCCLLYGLPRLVLRRQNAQEAPLGVELAVTRASLLDAASSRRTTARGAAFGVVRLGLLLGLASLSQFKMDPPWMRNGAAVEALRGITSNERRAICLNGVAPAMRFMGWHPWSISHDSSSLTTLSSDGCIHAPRGSGSVEVSSSMLASRIGTVNSTGYSSLTIEGLKVRPKLANGAVPLGRWKFWGFNSAMVVCPGSSVCLATPSDVFLDPPLFFLFADVFLDFYTIYTMLLSEDINSACVLLANTLFSTIREVRMGSLRKLRGWVAETSRTGVLADGLQNLLDNERGSEALISLLVSSYALPFTIKCPMDAVLCPLSVLSSAIGLGCFLHEYLDLPLGEPEDDEESDCTKDTENGEQSSSSSCTSSETE